MAVQYISDIFILYCACTKLRMQINLSEKLPTIKCVKEYSAVFCDTYVLKMGIEFQ